MEPTTRRDRTFDLYGGTLLAFLILSLSILPATLFGQELLLEFGGPGSGDGQFNEINGIAVADDGRIHVVDAGNFRVQVFDAQGNFLSSFVSLGTQGTAAGEFDSPCQMAIDGDGRLYVVDSGNARVQVFDSEGSFLFEFGELGAGDGPPAGGSRRS